MRIVTVTVRLSIVNALIVRCIDLSKKELKQVLVFEWKQALYARQKYTVRLFLSFSDVDTVLQ